MSIRDPFRSADHTNKCPQCGEALFWNEEDGLAGQLCACGYLFTGEESTDTDCN